MRLISLIFIFSNLVLVSSTEVRAEEVRIAFKELWANYKEHAFGSDELKPISKNKVNDRFQGWGATLVDSLSTLWLMDLKEEFYECVQHIKTVDFSQSNGNTVLFFETVIRFLGGLISGYDLSGEKILLQKAIQLADALLPAFDSPSGLPYFGLDFKNKRHVSNGGQVCLAEIGTIQLEFSRLTELTGNKIYREKAYKVYDHLDKLKKPRKGLYPVFLDENTGKFSTKQITFGALGDSFYEYLLKSYILDKNEKHMRMFKESMQGFETLVRIKSKDRHYFGDINSQGQFQESMDHLSFFMPGLIAFGSTHTNNLKWLNLADKLVHSCYQTYNQSRTGLGPEVIRFTDTGIEYTVPQNYLRPELLESLFYMYKITGKTKYQDYTYNIFKAFQKNSKTQFGYAVYRDVNNVHKAEQQIDVMESFFFAETFKYMYLAFKERDFINLNEWVFNTEAHPIKVNKH